MSGIKDFMNKAFIKNPLGVIALFISLIYGFSCLVLGTTLSNLHGCNERLPLIWFIIGFPILILLAFTYLVVFHHEKLYAPGDYTNEEHFFHPYRGNIKLTERLDETNPVQLVPINSLWQLNHWGSSYASIIDNKMIFSGVNAEYESDGPNIDFINFLEIGKSYEVSCFVKSEMNTTGKFQLWCHDNSGNPNVVSVTTNYKTPSIQGETIALKFIAAHNRNIRIHLQYKSGEGKIEVSDVKIAALPDSPFLR